MPYDMSQYDISHSIRSLFGHIFHFRIFQKVFPGDKKVKSQNEEYISLHKPKSMI